MTNVDGSLLQGEFGVKSAVDEFFAAHKLTVHVTDGPSSVEMFPSWIVEIPEAGPLPSAGDEAEERYSSAGAVSTT